MELHGMKLTVQPHSLIPKPGRFPFWGIETGAETNGLTDTVEGSVTGAPLIGHLQKNVLGFGGIFGASGERSLCSHKQEGRCVAKRIEKRVI